MQTRVQAVKFYLKFKSQLNKCANSQCYNGIGEDYVFAQLLNPKHTAVFTLLEYNIKPIFLCCNCVKKPEKIKQFEM